jgi:hypothetical protein
MTATHKRKPSLNEFMESVQHKLDRIEGRLGSATRATTTTPAPAAAAPARAAVTPKTSVEALWAEYHALPNATAKHRFWKQHRELHP